MEALGEGYTQEDDRVPCAGWSAHIPRVLAVQDDNTRTVTLIPQGGVPLALLDRLRLAVDLMVDLQMNVNAARVVSKSVDEELRRLTMLGRLRRDYRDHRIWHFVES